MPIAGPSPFPAIATITQQRQPQIDPRKNSNLKHRNSLMNCLQAQQNNTVNTKVFFVTRARIGHNQKWKRQ